MKENEWNHYCALFTYLRALQSLAFVDTCHSERLSQGIIVFLQTEKCGETETLESIKKKKRSNIKANYSMHSTMKDGIQIMNITYWHVTDCLMLNFTISRACNLNTRVKTIKFKHRQKPVKTFQDASKSRSLVKTLSESSQRYFTHLLQYSNAVQTASEILNNNGKTFWECF